MSQVSRRGSTQAPEAGPSTSRRQSSRPAAVEDDEEDSQPRRSSKASSSKRKIETHDEEDEADEDDMFGELAQPLEAPQIDEEFRNQPLKKDEATLKLNNLIKEWKEVDRKVQMSIELLANSAGELQETLAGGEEDAEAAEEITLADRDFRRLLDKIHEVRLRREALEALRKSVIEGRANPNAFDDMEKRVNDELERYNAQTSRQKYMSNATYADFRSLLWESLYGDSRPVPGIKAFIDREDGDPESDDEEIEVQGAAQNYKDPITFGWLTKPVRSNACKHVYSRASITEHIRQSHNKTSAACPVAGCNKIVILAALEDDPQLERRVQQHIRRLGEQQDRASGGYQAVEDDEEEEDSDEDDLNVRRVKKRED
ncbi:hypothetical protein P389DRAFT_169134 [Cystobasidium minutum MCA 4210]|uniref:uncharacterized protein n=1 Tax=Cystobasidium minutum MCA 4210 TaxID=1397322 RepID=UPI0034CD68B9|eukprot:jgi/Rhomi1/169134/fgenesh1_kg.3_\